MSEPTKEPRNPFYLLLLIAGLVFILTALAYAVVPVLEEKARDQGVVPPPSPWRDALRENGWRWLLWEVAVLVVLGLASMSLDRYWRWKKEQETPPPAGAARQTANAALNSPDPDRPPAP